MPSAAPLLAALVAFQAAAGARVVVRLLPGRHRAPPVAPLVDADDPRWAHVAGARVSVVVPTLNEAARIAPCLAGLAAQDGTMVEAIVVDGRSTDGTPALVEAAAARDPRLRVLVAPPQPPGWLGKVWQLDYARPAATGDWILGIDADAEPAPGLVAATVAAAEACGLDVVSFAPRFAGQSRAERWLQPAMLATLVYRLGAPCDRPRTDADVLANGQCFLVRRRMLDANGGYAPSRAYFADDVALARHLARAGARVGFLDGARLYTVRGYAGALDMWRGWGRSFALAPESTRGRHALDLATVTLAQGLPVLVLAALAVAVLLGALAWSPAWTALALVNVALLAVRIGVLVATGASYARRGLAYWASPTADPAAVVRLWLSTLRRARSWRGREFTLVDAPT